MECECTKEEKNAIAALRRLSKRWPDTLWIYSSPDGLCIMRKNTDGEHAYGGNNSDKDGVDPAYIVEIIDIDNDGGDW